MFFWGVKLLFLFYVKIDYLKEGIEMKVIGIVVEYNFFYNGYKLYLNKVCELI